MPAAKRTFIVARKRADFKEIFQPKTIPGEIKSPEDWELQEKQTLFE